MPTPEEKPAHDPGDDEEVQVPVDEVLKYADHCRKQADDVADIATKFGDDARIGSRNFTTWVEVMQSAFATTAVAIALGPAAPVAFVLEAHYVSDYKKTVDDFADKYETARWKTQERLKTISAAIEILGVTAEEFAKNTENTDKANAGRINDSSKGD